MDDHDASSEWSGNVNHDPRAAATMRQSPSPPTLLLSPAVPVPLESEEPLLPASPEVQRTTEPASPEVLEEEWLPRQVPGLNFPWPPPSPRTMNTAGSPFFFPANEDWFRPDEPYVEEPDFHQAPREEYSLRQLMVDIITVTVQNPGQDFYAFDFALTLLYITASHVDQNQAQNDVYIRWLEGQVARLHNRVLRLERRFINMPWAIHDLMHPRLPTAPAWVPQAPLPPAWTPTGVQQPPAAVPPPPATPPASEPTQSNDMDSTD